MLPSAEPQRLGREEHVLADRCRLADERSSTPDGSRIDSGKTCSVLRNPSLSHRSGFLRGESRGGRPRCSCRRLQMHSGATPDPVSNCAINEISDALTIADGQKPGGARPVRVPEVVAAHRRHAAGNVEPIGLKHPTLCPIDVEELAALLLVSDLAQLAGSDLVVEDVKPFVVGQEQRGMLPPAAVSSRKVRPLPARVRCRRRQIPEREPSGSSARAGQQRFLEFAQRHRGMGRLVAEKGPHCISRPRPESPGAPRR